MSDNDSLKPAIKKMVNDSQTTTSNIDRLTDCFTRMSDCMSKLNARMSSLETQLQKSNNRIERLEKRFEEIFGKADMATSNQQNNETDSQYCIL